MRFYSTKPVRLRSQPVICKLCEVTFDRPAEEVPDWDDRQKSSRQLTAVKVKTGAGPSGPACQSRSARPAVCVSKQGGDPDEPEPSCSAVEGSHWDADLRVAAVCDYSAFSCSADSIHFQDTELYQSRHRRCVSLPQHQHQPLFHPPLKPTSVCVRVSDFKYRTTASSRWNSLSSCSWIRATTKRKVNAAFV